ncbi:pentatricopeptide repeat-containing protein At2g13600-like [Phoenix dactylifera]|uniref:Pentatricopeptide repeat-containing protein At2g13600-like n=1 Tax=Phoenix dactylifera TaxID=42345 RepID=A0A8B7CP74_PHODC|nr:pentatricopeptide repeat-containing protein At2g13600-like [Phoenix dactylifera]
MGYAEAGEHAEALRIFKEMVENDQLVMNEHVYSCALRACARTLFLFDRRRIQAQVIKSKMASNAFEGTSLVDVYEKSGDKQSAKKAFLEISEPSAVSWNVLIAGGLSGEEVLRLFGRMRLPGISPDHMTFACVLRACKDILTMRMVQRLRGLTVKMMEVELDVLDAKVFLKCTWILVALMKLHEAVGLFLEALEMEIELSEVTMTSLLMTEGLDQWKQFHALVIKFGYCDNIVSVSMIGSLIRMYSEHHCLDDALRLFEQIDHPDLVLWTSAFSGFSRSGKSQDGINLYLEEASRLFNEMPERDLASWNAMISSLAQHGFADQAIGTFQELLKQTDIKPNNITSVGVLSTCSRHGMVEKGYQCFKSIQEPAVDHYSCVVDMFGRTGRLKEAMDVFQSQ